jgi:hypothetical protein
MPSARALDPSRAPGSRTAAADEWSRREGTWSERANTPVRETKAWGGRTNTRSRAHLTPSARPGSSAAPTGTWCSEGIVWCRRDHTSAVHASRGDSRAIRIREPPRDRHSVTRREPRAPGQGRFLATSPSKMRSEIRPDFGQLVGNPERRRNRPPHLRSFRSWGLPGNRKGTPALFVVVRNEPHGAAPLRRQVWSPS